MNAPPVIFDHRLIRTRRERSGSAFAAHDFLHRRAMNDIIDRLETVTRTFPLAAFFGAASLTEMLTPSCGVGSLFSVDLATSRLDPANAPALVADQERSPFAPNSFDLIVSVLTLHHANDLVGALSQARAALKPDGLFIAALFGEDTLKDLRTAFYTAETEIVGGVSPRVAPFASVRDLGSALQRAGFALPVADIDRVQVRYQNPMRLIEDLRGMGETNALMDRSRSLTRTIFAQTMSHFEQQGGIAGFDIVYLTGWSPHEDQQKPLKPGAAKQSLQTAITQSRDADTKKP